MALFSSRNTALEKIDTIAAMMTMGKGVGDPLHPILTASPPFFSISADMEMSHHTWHHPVCPNPMQWTLYFGYGNAFLFKRLTPKGVSTYFSIPRLLALLGLVERLLLHVEY